MSLPRRILAIRPLWRSYQLLWHRSRGVVTTTRHSLSNLRLLSSSPNFDPNNKGPDRNSPFKASLRPWIVGGLAVGFLIGVYEGWKSHSLHLDSKPTQLLDVDGHLRFVSLQEVQSHNTKDSCWVIIGNKVYEYDLSSVLSGHLVDALFSLTNFMNVHPGGAEIIQRYAGTDADSIFTGIHSPNVLNLLKPEDCVGKIDITQLSTRQADLAEEERVRFAREHMPPVVAMVNLHDFETVASKVMTSKAWAYYSSAAEDEASYDNNLRSFKRYWFRPRVMRPVGEIDLTTSILGIPTALPIFVSPAALAGLSNEEGEVPITRAVGKAGIIQGISSNASRSIEDIAAARLDQQQPLFFQLYMNKDRKESERIVRLVTDLGFRAIMLTVDAPMLGKRERDIKNRLPTSDDLEDTKQMGVSASLDSAFNANLQWSDIAWLKSLTHLPIIIKGVQTVEDVELAVQHGAAGVLLSNHGGRQMDYAPAAIDVLYELRQRRPDLLGGQIEIYIDGGIRRGTDVLKALALGATAVGLGRPVLYANGTYGERGVSKMIKIMEEEIALNMRLIGARNFSELTPEMVSRQETCT